MCDINKKQGSGKNAPEDFIENAEVTIKPLSFNHRQLRISSYMVTWKMNNVHTAACARVVLAQLEL